MCVICPCSHTHLTIGQQLTTSLSPTDYNVNVGVLETAHSIFRPWRAHVRSDELFTEINLVLGTFMTPFLQLFRQTTNLLLTSGSPPPPNYPLLAQAQRTLVDIYYDFTCQDLPPDLEDSHEEFFAPGSGHFQRFLEWDPVELRVDVSHEYAWHSSVTHLNLQPDETTPSLPSQIKTGILEIAEVRNCPSDL
jgi:exportin-2 (importin alpha re-exporter)